jgi:hypothetical protein
MGDAPSRGWLPETASPLSSKVRPATGLYLIIPRCRRISFACRTRFSIELSRDVPSGFGLLRATDVSGGSSPPSRAKNLANASMLVQLVPPIRIDSR